MTRTEYLAKKIKEANDKGFAWLNDQKRRLKIVPSRKLENWEWGEVLIRNRGKIQIVEYTTKDAFPRFRANAGFYFSQKQVMAIVAESHPYWNLQPITPEDIKKLKAHFESTR